MLRLAALSLLVAACTIEIARDPHVDVTVNACVELIVTLVDADFTSCPEGGSDASDASME